MLNASVSILSQISLFSLLLVTACDTSGPSATGDTDGWSAERALRTKALEKHLDDNAVAFSWFADFPFGTTEGIPYLILRSLPLIAPEEWGSREG